MNAEPDSTESTPVALSPIAFDAEIIYPAPAEVDLKFNRKGEVEAPDADGSWIGVGVVNIIVDDGNGTIPEVFLNLTPAVRCDTLEMHLAMIEQDGVPHDGGHPTVSWTSNNDGYTRFTFKVPRGNNTRNPRTWVFSSILRPAPLRVKVRITRIDSQRLDGITG